jgi:molybdopterin molybdotransferase
MDGYAVRAPDTAGAPVRLRLVGEARAGSPCELGVAPGEAIRISTGAPLPEGADAVIRQELTTAAGGEVELAEAVGPGNDVRRAGEDVRAGTTVLRAGARLGPAELGVLASLDVATPSVVRRPRVALVGTGDELVDPGRPLGPGEIRDTNGPALAGAARRAGAEVVARVRVGDDLESTVLAVGAALDAADVLVTAGGVSVGPHDHIRPALERLGVREVFAGVDLRPGRPTTFGALDDGRLVFALPGNPVSALIAFRLFALPALDALLGRVRSERTTTAIADAELPGARGRTAIVRCRADLRADGWHVTPTGAQGSHVLTSMLGVDALALVPPERAAVAAGEAVDVELDLPS